MQPSGTVALAAVVLAGVAAAEPVTLTIDPLQSSIAATVTASGVSDTETSAVSGTLSLCLNDPDAPTVISVSGVNGILEADPVFFLNYGVGGTITVTGIDLTAAYAQGAPPAGPVPVAPDGSFAFAAPNVVPIVLSGTLHVVGTGLVGAVLGTQNLNAADFGVFPAELTAAVSDDGATLTVSGVADFSGQSDVLPITVFATGTLNVVATAPLPAAGCPCDYDCTSGVDVFDLLAYLDLWFASDPAAELTGDATVDVFDLLAYLACWFPASAGAC